MALLWSILGSVDIIATAQGKIVPTGRTKIIQPFETGVVRSIHVQDGQIVKAGDILVEIDSTINESERDRLQKEYVDTRDSSEPKGQELNYAARVLLDQTQMQVDDRLVGLVPGMAVTIEIKTGSRRIISYLLSPIQKHLHQAMRER